MLILTLTLLDACFHVGIISARTSDLQPRGALTAVCYQNLHSAQANTETLHKPASKRAVHGKT